MQITNPIPGLDNFLLVKDDNDNALSKLWFSQSTKFVHVARPGAAHKDLAGLGVDFIVRAADIDEAKTFIGEVWA